MTAFRDRVDAGRRLGEALADLRDRQDVTVLGLPRGGVVVAAEVARSLNAPLDVFLVRKLGVPGHEELAMGAIASGSVRVLADEIITRLGISEEDVARTAVREEAVLAQRERLYRRGPSPAIAGRTVVVVDDGVATGATMTVAVRAIAAGRPERVVVAVPVGDARVCAALGRVADRVVCLVRARGLGSVGEWYEDFSQVSDEECVRLLSRPPPASTVGTAS
ncbi:MAG: phosphoribosyltransferase family protein [Actinomycetota bacterium]